MSLQSRIAELEAELKQLKREASRPRLWEEIPNVERETRDMYSHVKSRCVAGTLNIYTGKYSHCGMSRMKSSTHGLCVAHEHKHVMVSSR